MQQIFSLVSCNDVAFKNILNVSFCNVLHRFANVMDLQLLITTLLMDDVGYENFIDFLIFRKKKEKKRQT